MSNQNPAGMTDEQVQFAKEFFSKPENLNPGKPHGNAFIALVDAYQQKHDCKRSEAILSVAQARPDLHKAWLDEQQPKTKQSQPTDGPGIRADSHQFMSEAKHYSAEKQIPLSKAIAHIAAIKPQLHEQFIQEVQ